MADSKEAKPEALIDLRTCVGKRGCGARSYFRKTGCLNALCDYYYLKQRPSERKPGPWARGKDSKKGKEWSWKDWRKSDTQNQAECSMLRNALMQVRQEMESESEAHPDAAPSRVVPVEPAPVPKAAMPPMPSSPAPSSVEGDVEIPKPKRLSGGFRGRAGGGDGFSTHH